jgi:hypothetical protein
LLQQPFELASKFQRPEKFLGADDFVINAHYRGHGILEAGYRLTLSLGGEQHMRILKVYGVPAAHA